LIDAAAHYRGLERMYARAACNTGYTHEVQISEGEARLSLPVSPAYFHAAGAVHGHVYFKMLDDAAFFAAASVMPASFVVTVSFTTYMVRPLSEGVMCAHGTAVHRGRGLVVAEAVLTDGDGVPIARGSGSFMKAGKPWSMMPGYLEEAAS